MACPGCGKTKSGTPLWECMKCGHKFCELCGDGRFKDDCPRCSATAENVKRKGTM